MSIGGGSGPAQCFSLINKCTVPFCTVPMICNLKVAFYGQNIIEIIIDPILIKTLLLWGKKN